MRNSIKDSFSEIKDVKGRRSIRDRSEEVNFLPNRMKLSNNEDRSNSEPPRSYGSYLPPTSSRLKPIREKKTIEDAQGSSDEDGDLSKSNSQLNESDLDLEIPDSASVSVSQTPTPTPLAASNARRINSETNLNDSKRRLSGFMGNRSKRFCASTSELSFTSHLDTQKSLFSAKNNALSRQSFNSSLYGSNMSLSSTNSRLFMANSPFYSGKTMFGGASAYPKRDINQHKILRTPVLMRPSSSLSNSSNTSAKSDNMMPESNAAKRILEVMNQFSGPLKEARSMGNNINAIIKIPSMVQNRQRYGEDELNLDRSIALSSPSIPYGRPLPGAQLRRRPESRLLNASIKPLQIPTMSQLLQMKRLQNNTEKVREIVSRSDSFLNRNQEYKLPSASVDTQSPTSGSSSLKMKSNITKNLLRNDKNSLNDQLPALPVNLPNIQLPQLKSIPKFDIRSDVLLNTGTPQLKTTNNSIVPTPSIQFNFQNTQTSLKQNLKTTAVMKSDFILSKPTPACDENFDASSLLNHSREKFILSKPLPISEIDFDNHNEILAKSPNKSLSSPASDSLFQNLAAKQKSGSWQCESCLSPNDIEKDKCLSCNASKPGSQSNSQKSLLVNSSAPAADDLFKGLAAQQKKTQWECDACMTKNDVGKDKCACCETPKPGSKPEAQVKPASTFTFGMPAASQNAPPSDDLFKTLAAQQKKTQWECDACMTKNDVDKDKCACCETPKPGSKPVSSTSLAAASTFTFGTNAAQQKKTQWECDACMIKNDASKDKCVCCETPKPGIKTTVYTASMYCFGMKPPSDSPESTFSFGMPKTSNDETFKKIVQKQSASWECTACLTFNEPSKSKCICCEQTKPGSEPAAPQFSFGSRTSSSVTLPTPAEVKFSFGMPAAQADSDNVESSAVEKKDEVDQPIKAFGVTNNSFSKLETTKLSTESATVVAPTFTFKAPSSTSTVSAAFVLQSPTNNDKKAEEIQPVDKPPLFSFWSPSKAQEPEKKSLKFGDMKAPEPIKALAPEQENKTLAFGDIKAPEPIKTLSQPTTAVDPVRSDFGGFKFSEKTTEPPRNVPTFGSSLNNNGGFSFGGFGSKPAESVPVEPIKPVVAIQPSAPGGFSFGGSGNQVSFGNPSATTVSTPAPAINTFSFGASKPENTTTFGSFGSTSALPAKTTFQMNNVQSAPVFGQSNATSAFSFSAKKVEQNEAPSSVFSFGSKPEQPSSAPMLFGNNQSNQASVLTPMFGANVNPNFGSSSSVNNNNESGFGSKMPSFGSVTQPQKRAFDFSGPTPEMPQTKKFDFGGHQQQHHPQPQQINNTNATPFQFNAAQGNENKPAFNFGAMPSSSPIFNFSNPTANNPQDQQNLFQFGTNSSNSTQGVFAFTPQSAPVMQFGSGAAAPSNAFPGINSFSAQGTASSAAANQRKILRASRRTMQRR